MKYWGLTRGMRFKAMGETSSTYPRRPGTFGSSLYSVVLYW